jgi:hypothetical protein
MGCRDRCDEERELALTMVGFQVRDSDTGLPICDAVVVSSDGRNPEPFAWPGHDAEPQTCGYLLRQQRGRVVVNITAAGYQSTTAELTIILDECGDQPVDLIPRVVLLTPLSQAVDGGNSGPDSPGPGG